MLQKKIDQSLRLLQSAGKIAREHGQPLEIAYSGGKDSDVILELAKMSGVEYRAIYKNTTIDPPGTIKHVRDNGVEVLQPKMSFKEVIEHKGMPNRWRRFCCGVLKEYKVLDYAVIGVRRDESRARADRYKEPEMCRVYSKKDKVRQYFPLLTWTNEDVAQFIKERGIICHALYYDEQGNFHPERRLGCMCCPLMSRRKRIQEFKKYPKMLRYYVSAAQKHIESHPNTWILGTFHNSPYEWMTFQLFYDSGVKFKRALRPTLFDSGVDTKQFLEKYFNVTL